MKPCFICGQELPVPGFEPKSTPFHDTCGRLACLHEALAREAGESQPQKAGEEGA